jgi:hypothetical protein
MKGHNFKRVQGGRIKSGKLLSLIYIIEFDIFDLTLCTWVYFGRVKPDYCLLFQSEGSKGRIDKIVVI